MSNRFHRERFKQARGGDSGASGAGAPTSQCFVYQPGGGASGPGVFDTWAALITALNTTRTVAGGGGCFDILFDDTSTSPAVVPAGGPYDMTDVRWLGRTDDFLTSMTIADGASFTNLRQIERNLSVTNLNTTTPADSTLVNGDVVLVDLDCTVQTVAGGVALWDGAGVASGHTVIVFLNRASVFGFSDTGPVFDFPTSGSTLFIVAGVSCFLPSGADVLTGAAGTTLITAGQSMAAFPNTYPAWAGTVSDPRLDTPGSVLPNPYLAAASTGTVTANFSQWLRFDASGGAIAQTLPDISSATYSQPGSFLVLSEESGTAGLTGVPAGGDTINGAGGAVTVSAGGTLVLMSDGLSNWQVIAEFDPSFTSDHGALAGLLDDDHTQYLLLAGRAGGQSAFGGTGVGDILTLTGSTDAALGIIQPFSPIELQNIEAAGQTTAYSIKQEVSYGTAVAGAVIQGTIISNRTLTINVGVWFIAQIVDQGTYIQAVTPGFSAFTLFNAFPVISTGPGGTAAATLIGSLTVSASIVHENDGDGAGMVAPSNAAVAFRPSLRATTVADAMTLTQATGISVIPVFDAEVVGSTVTFDSVIGVSILEPTTVGHLGTGVLTEYVGLDYTDIAFGTGLKIAVRSALTAAASSYFLRHTGTARSDFGGSIFLGAGATVDVELSRGAANRLDLATGDSFRIISGALEHVAGTVGFFGTTPTTQSAAYTPTNVSADRAYDANATSVNELADVLGTLIADLQLTGLLA